MREIQQRKLEALRRVQGFIGTHSGVLGPIADLEGRKEVDAAVAAVDELTNGQGRRTGSSPARWVVRPRSRASS